MFKRKIAVALSLILCAAALSACKAPEKILKVFNKEQIFTMNDIGCEKAEYLVYLSTTQSRYEDVYGAEVWNVSRGDVTLEDNVKQTVLARIARVKIMYLMAKEQGIKPDEAEGKLIEQAADRYLEELGAESAESMGLTKDLLKTMYEQYFLSEKVYESIISSVNPEISDDEARTVTVQSILLKTWTTDGTGERIPYPEKMQDELREEAQSIVALAKDGEDFQELISKYNEGTESLLSFGKGEMDPALERMAFALETGEISPVIETEEGFRIIKCISTFEREQTERNKKAIIEKRKEEAFTASYKAFADSVESSLNAELLGQIAPNHDSKLEVPDFFLIYEDLF